MFGFIKKLINPLTPIKGAISGTKSLVRGDLKGAARGFAGASGDPIMAGIALRRRKMQQKYPEKKLPTGAEVDPDLQNPEFQNNPNAGVQPQISQISQVPQQNQEEEMAPLLRGVLGRPTFLGR